MANQVFLIPVFPSSLRLLNHPRQKIPPPRSGQFDLFILRIGDTLPYNAAQQLVKLRDGAVEPAVLADRDPPDRDDGVDGREDEAGDGRVEDGLVDFVKGGDGLEALEVCAEDG